MHTCKQFKCIYCKHVFCLILHTQTHKTHACKGAKWNAGNCMHDNGISCDNYAKASIDLVDQNANVAGFPAVSFD